ncbi:MAG: hypothetical protein IKN04_01140 [Clostridia bacterium]|nr:hypothetical protein [Clostridia bacterium]
MRKKIPINENAGTQDEKKRIAEEKYIGGDVSLRALAAELGLSASTLGKWKKAGEWEKKRDEVQQRAMKKAATQAVNKKARELCRLLEASDEMEYALLLAARAVVKNLCEDEEGLIVTDGKERADNMTRIVRAINQQAETRMRLSGIMDQAEQEKIALLWRKQELDERKEAQDQASEKEGVLIKMDAETEAFSE